MFVCAVLNTHFLRIRKGHGDLSGHLRIGYYLWAGSFFLIAAGLAKSGGSAAPWTSTTRFFESALTAISATAVLAGVSLGWMLLRSFWEGARMDEMSPSLSARRDMTPPPDQSIIEILQKRQRYILARLPVFAKVTFLASGIVLAVYSLARLIDGSTGGSTTEINFKNINLAMVIAGVLSLISNFAIGVFVVWSLFFIPYIGYHAHRASRDTPKPVATRDLRWIQLYAATFLPMAVFAIAWTSIATTTDGRYTLRIETPIDLLVLVLGIGVVVGAIFAINRLIPVKLAAIRLSFFSSLLYLSLFLAYGRGVTMASHSMVFGILLYLMFWAGDFSELARRISLHDIDSRLAERFEQIVARYEDVQNLKDETHLSRKEHEAQATKQKLQIEVQQSESDLALGAQLADMRAKKLSLTKKMNEVQLEVLEKKIDTYGAVFGILSGEMRSRLGDDIPLQIAELKTNVKNLSPEEIQVRMNQIMHRLNDSLQGIPESLAGLRTQLLETTTEIERQTRLIAAESDSQDAPPRPS
jgi:signal transduction histidine kinase